MSSGTINPVITNEFLTPTKLNYNDLLRDVKPRMNVNIPLMQRTTTPTWTTERTRPFEPFQVGEASPTPTPNLTSSEASPPTNTESQQYDANSQWLQQAASYMNPDSPVRPLALGYIYARSSQRMRVNGNIVGSGLSWARDAQITSQMQNFQGGQNAADRALAEQMQNKSLQQQLTLQTQNQDFQKQMQQNSFDFQHIMQGGQFQHENEMQGKDIANQQQMQASNQAFTSSMSDKTFGQNKTLTGMNIAGNLANTALGGVVGVAGNIVSKGMDMYVQQQNFHNQQSLMTQNFNQQIQASGSRAGALKLTTDM